MIALWMIACVLMSGATVVIAELTRRRFEREHDEELRRLERKRHELERRAPAKPPREVTLGYEVRREGNDMVLVFKRDGVVAEQYWMTDQAAARLVSAIVEKFEA